MRRPLLLLLPVALAGCHRTSSNAAPPRVDAQPQAPAEASRIVVPVAANLDQLARAIDAQTPRMLWRIDQDKPDCVASKRVGLAIAHIRTPRLGCHIVGEVTHGPITLGGEGRRLVITMPVTAQVAADHIGGLVRRETATGAATVHAIATLGLAGNWQPTATVAIRYDWTQEPGVTLLGQRITFTSKADEKLRGVIAKLQAQLPGQLGQLHLRDKLAGVWRQAFTSLSLNRDNPPAWLRVTPQRLGFGGYQVEGRQLVMTLAAEALTQTFVGPRPADPVPTPLPPPTRTVGERGLNFFIPVVADYHQLEPVVERTLDKLSRRGITLSGIGPVDASFGKVTVYATTGGRLAVGVRARVKAKHHQFVTTKGEVWLTGVPYNQPGSQLVRARDLQIASSTDSRLADIMVRLFNDTGVRDSIVSALSHDFAPDYNKVIGKARAAIAAKREGDFLLSANVTSVTNGQLAATGAGLFMPVRAEGVATIRYAPR